MRELASAIDAVDRGCSRVVVVQRASEKFFSAGADIKRFLDETSRHNMEMIRSRQAAFRRMAGRRSCSSPTSPATRSAAA